MAVFAEWLIMGWSFLAESTLVPNWLLALLTICAIIVAGILGRRCGHPESVYPDTSEPTDKDTAG